MLDKDFNTELLIARRRKRWKAKEEELRAESRNGKCADQEDSAGLSLQVGWLGRWLVEMLGYMDACLDARMLGRLDACLVEWVGSGWLLGCLDAWMLGCLLG